jgi:ornithine decarboxylase
VPLPVRHPQGWPETPCLVVDLDVVEFNFRRMRELLPQAKIFYAMKANPANEVLARLGKLGSYFDTASRGEIELCMAQGVGTERVSFGNTIKKEKDIAWAHQNGVRLFAFDSEAELQKLARSAPGAKVFCRVLVDCGGAEWPLSKKFGCAPEMARDLLKRAHDMGLEAYGVSFHVGSQQTDTAAWDRALADASRVFHEASERGIQLAMVNLGGGFPTRYLRDVPSAEAYGHAIFEALRRHFGNRIPETIIEPGRGMVGDAGVLKAEVVLVSKKSREDKLRWVYLDVGKFGGLAETMDEAIRYPIRTRHDGSATAPCVIAGPTCDSADVLYEKTPYDLPLSLSVGDEVFIEGTGAYTTTYAAVAFNGFAPLASYVI